MTALVNRSLLWAPRVLCAAFAVFVGLFALDAFEPGRSVWQNAAAFGVHLTPAFIVLALLGVGWRWPTVAGVLLIGVGGWYALMPGPRQHLTWILAIAGPAWLCGVLFLLSGRTPAAH